MNMYTVMDPISITDLHAVHQLQSQHIGHILSLHIPPHTSPSQLFFGVFVVSILEKIGHVALYDRGQRVMLQIVSCLFGARP